MRDISDRSSFASKLPRPQLARVSVRLATLLMALSVATSGNQAHSQGLSQGGGTSQMMGVNTPPPMSMPYPFMGMGGFGWGMPGTAASSSQFGMASMISSAGYANLMNSQAANNYQEARSKDFQNRLQWTNTYQEIRRAHRAYIAERPKLSMDQIREIARQQVPKRLDSTQLDMVTGEINWPTVLRDPRYTEQKQRLESLVQARLSTGGYITAQQQTDIRQACDQLMAQVQANINEYDAGQFSSARTFIESLRFEMTSS